MRRVHIAPGLFRVSLPGFDAVTTGVENLAFWEGQQGLAPLASGFVPASQGTIIIPYIGLRPLFFAWRSDTYQVITVSRKSDTELELLFAGGTIFYIVYRTGVPL